MSFELVLQTVIPIFLIIALGYFIALKKEIDAQPVIDLLVYIAAPSLIFSSMARAKITVGDFGIIFLAAALITLIQGFFVYFVLRMRSSAKTGLFLPLTIGNTGYLGYPVALFAFGALGLSNAIVYDIVGSLFLYSIGIYIVHHKNDIKEMFKIPLLYAVLLGILFNIFKVNVPDIIFKPIEMIGAITIPAALLVLGYKLKKIKVSSAFKAFIASCFKIFGGFIIAFAIVSLLNISGLIRNIILLQAAMPSAVMSMILTHKYGRDSELVASIVFISTIMSILTIPLILLFITP